MPRGHRVVTIDLFPTEIMLSSVSAIVAFMVNIVVFVLFP